VLSPRGSIRWNIHFEIGRRLISRVEVRDGELSTSDNDALSAASSAKPEDSFCENSVEPDSDDSCWTFSITET